MFKGHVDSGRDWVVLPCLVESCQSVPEILVLTALVPPPCLLNSLSPLQLSVAYKNVIGARRASWRNLNGDEGTDNTLIAEYKRQVEAELEAICREVLAILEDVLINSPADAEAQVFYLKMTGDYYRYLAEFKDKRDGCHEKARNFYQRALDIARGEGPNRGPGLAPTNPIRLGLALNFSVCYYEILGEKGEACELARRAFDDAISQLDDLDENSYKDSTLIMQLLRDNLTLWTAESNDLLTQDVDPDMP